jgi:hypothetical protein
MALVEVLRPTPVLSALAVTALFAGAISPSPLRAQIAVMGSTVEERTAAPGETYAGTIIIRNLTRQTQPVRIYQSDYTFQADGTSHFDAPGTVARSNAMWITPSTKLVLIPPEGDMTVSYTVGVPAIDTMRGTFWSTIMIEGAVNAPGPAQSKQVSLGTVTRYAVQVATHLAGGAGKTSVSFANQRTRVETDGKIALELEVTNDGESAHRPLLWVELYDSKGAMLAKREQQRGLLYPGTSLKQTFLLGKLPPGDYKAAVFADAGDDLTFAAQYKLHF